LFTWSRSVPYPAIFFRRPRMGATATSVHHAQQRKRSPLLPASSQVCVLTLFSCSSSSGVLANQHRQRGVLPVRAKEQRKFWNENRDRGVSLLRYFMHFSYWRECFWGSEKNPISTSPHKKLGGRCSSDSFDRIECDITKSTCLRWYGHTSFLSNFTTGGVFLGAHFTK